MIEREDRAREWLVKGGGGHEGGEDGLRALSVSGFGLIGFLADYAEYLEATPDPQPAPAEGWEQFVRSELSQKDREIELLKGQLEAEIVRHKGTQRQFELYCREVIAQKEKIADIIAKVKR